MTRPQRDNRGAAVLAVLVLAAAGLYLAYRSWGAAAVAFAPAPAASEPRVAETVPQVVAAAARDSSLAAFGAPGRDPFHPPAAAHRASGVRTPAPPAPDPPQLRMILYDQVSPEVQLEVDGELSGRLRPGQSFRGWKVESISPRACVVERDGRILTLTPRR